jgi:hypothetical protein
MKERSREAEGDDTTYLWYNVMLIEWDKNHASASRLGLGWVKKEQSRAPADKGHNTWLTLFNPLHESAAEVYIPL